MKKNLKKLISAVVALALSVGSVAMANFTDVADTAANAKAINTLAALGVISGYEDGSFKPDNNITRAEVATMVVAALNRSADAAGSKGTTKFADVNTEAKAWASGYVNIGVAEGFISGYEDGTFKPDNNVTYAEMISMLVRIAGYGSYAEYLGGWPNGYISVANDKGVTQGVSAAADVAVTRAQVAQMIYNTLLNVPIVESTSLRIDSYGNLVPDMTIMDGKNDNDYKTLLTEKHDAYYVEGNVTATNRTDSSTYDADEVSFDIEYTKNYDGETAIEKGDAAESVRVYVGNTDAADYLKTYAAAIIKVDEDGDATFIDFVPSGKNNVVTFDTSLIEEDDFDIDFGSNETPYVKYYDSKDASKPAKYSLNPTGVELYVNGVEVDWTAANFDKYVVNNTSGVVQYVDQYKSSSKADGKYDLIFVTYYGTAIVGAVNASTGRISFADKYNLDKGFIVLDPEDEDVTASIYFNGEEIDYTALKEDDVVSIAYDVEAGVEDSKFYEIYVSRDTAEGKVMGKDQYDETVKIGDASYEFVQGYSMASELNFADEYTLFLDAFGRIFAFEMVASSAKLAVIDRFIWSSTEEYYRAMLYTTDGSSKNLNVDLTEVGKSSQEILKKVYNDINEDGKIDKYEDVNDNNAEKSEITTSNKTSIENRVVKYKISNSTGRIIYLEFVDGKGGEDLTYKERSSALGTLKINNATKIIDAVEYDAEDPAEKTYDKLAVSSIAGLVDGSDYEAYGYDKNSNGYYNLVLITKDGGGYTFDTNFAVLTKTPAEGIEEETEDDIFVVNALYQGAEIEMVANYDVDVYIDGAEATATDLSKGDVVVFMVDGDNKIKRIDALVTAAEIGLDANYTKTVDNAMKNAVSINTADATNWTTKWNTSDINTSKEITQLLYGPVISKSSSMFTLGSFIKSDKLTLDGEACNHFATLVEVDASEEEEGSGGYKDVNITDDTNVVIYDFTKGEKFRLSAGLKSDIVACTVTNNQYKTAVLDGDEKGEAIDWEEDALTDNMIFAFAKVVDDIATDVFVIIGDEY